VRTRRPTTRIIALAAALALIPAAALANSTGGTTGPSGSTGTTGHTGATGHHTPPPPKPKPKPTPTPAPLPAAEVAHLQKVMAKAMTPLGPHSGAYAVDLENGEVLFDDDAAVPRNPASVEKLYTLTTALDRFGLNGTLQTDVYGSGQLEAGGLYRGTIYLRGGGDPTFGSPAFIKANYGIGTSVQALAQTLIAQTGIRKVKGSIAGDESYFDSRRGGPSTNYGIDPNLVGQLSALAFNRGETGRLGSPAAYAAFELAGALRHDGVVVTGRSHAGIVDLISAKLLASIDSPPMTTLARLTAVPSDDFFAEMILKALGARFGSGGTTAAGAAVVSEFLRTIHLSPAVADGSGLSRADRTSPLDVVTLLRDLSPGGITKLQAVGTALRDAMPVVSETGTLALRMHHTAASGRCVAKTGTLSDASDLAGWCNGVFAFAFLMNHVDPYAAETAQDKMTIALAKLTVPAVPAVLPRR
jgi:D-alanyl-D-alanine carboxypeptidase/D-alanyl-D-alanine-endopeptidase (penicillin-binding protein 4)